MMKKKVGLIFWFVMLFLVLVSCIGDLGAQLDGTAWRLVFYGGKHVIPGSSPTLIFEKGRVTGNASCNNFGSSFDARGSQLEIGDVESTLMACLNNDLMDQESNYMHLLSEADHFEIIDAQLVITTTDGKLLVFDRTE